MTSFDDLLFRPMNRFGAKPNPNEQFVVVHRNLPREIPYAVSAIYGRQQLPVIVLGKGSRTGFLEYRQFYFNNEE